MSTQTGWRWCRNCQGLFFAGGETQGICIGANAHDGSASGKYLMQFGEGAGNTQPQGGWRWCHQCQAMHFAGAPSDVFGEGARRMCFGTLFSGGPPPDGSHDPSQSAHYVMEFGEGRSDAQEGWRFCKKCFGLYFSGNPDQGNCPAGGKHDNSKSGPYILHFEPGLPPPVTSKVFESGPLTTNHPLGAWVKVVVDDLGSVTFSGSMHDSGFDNIQGTVAGVIMTADGIAYTVQHSGHTEGTIAGLPFGTPNRDHSWIESTANLQIKADWANVSQATFTAQLSGNDLTSDGVTALIGDTIKAALASAGVAAGKAVVALF